MRHIAFFNFRCLLGYFVFLIIFPSDLFAQSLSFRLGVNYTQFNMSELKDVQKEITSSIASFLPLKDLESFPAYYAYELQLIFEELIFVDVGFSIGYMSTGARSYYADYSGKYSIDYLTDATSFAVNIEKMVFDSDIDLLLGAKWMFITTDFTVDEILSVEEESDRNTIETTSSSFGLTLNGSVQYQISSFLIRANLGYLIDFKDDLHKVGDPDDFLLTSNGDKVSADWSGLFVGLTFGYKIDLQ